MIRLNCKGDTIVEVLIAITIAASILAGAFVSARRSVIGTRQSQERSEGLKVAEKQLENLRLLSAQPGNQFIDTSKSSTSCLTNATPAVWTSVANIYPVDSENFSDTNYHPTACTVAPAAGVEYFPAIRRTVPVAGEYNFEVIVHWQAAGGNGNQEVKLAYRLYQ